VRRGRLAPARDGNWRRRGERRVVPLAGMGVAAQLAQEDAQPLGVDAVAAQQRAEHRIVEQLLQRRLAAQPVARRRAGADDDVAPIIRPRTLLRRAAR